MGLDMHLKGRTFNWSLRGKREMKDGFEVEGVTLILGYWRKHPDLHGYIVQEFADGHDKCQEIPLTVAAIRQIIDAIKRNALPHTEGFFFGESDGSEDVESIAVFERALAWLEGETPPVRRSLEPIGGGLAAMEVRSDDFVEAKESRDVFYLASW